MRFFIDTACVDDVKPYLATGLIDGITTNPSLIAKNGEKLEAVVGEFCKIVDGPVSAEVMAPDSKGMIEEGKRLSQIASNVVIKLPLTMQGLEACNALTALGIMTNITLCFSPVQALMAAKAGATFVSPFVGRLDDIAYDGVLLVKDIVEIFTLHDIDTLVLAASIRHPLHVAQVAKQGADIATIPISIFKKMIENPLTDKGIALFESDWNKVF